MEHSSSVTLSGFCEHVISKTQSEVYRLSGECSLKIQDGKARRRERRAELRKKSKKIIKKFPRNSLDIRKVDVYLLSQIKQVYVMKGSRYYKNLDFSKPVGTHRYVDNIKDRRQLAKVALVAMARINQAEQGTITCPYELASSSMKDGRTLIQTIYEDGYVMYNDGWFIVECDESGCLYVDVTGTAVRECPEYDNMEYVMDAACKEAHEECLAALAEDENN